MKTKEEYLKAAKDELQWILNYKGQLPVLVTLTVSLLLSNEKISNPFWPTTGDDLFIFICMVISIVWAIITFRWKFPEEKISLYADYLKSEDLRKEKLKKEKLERLKEETEKAIEELQRGTDVTPS